MMNYVRIAQNADRIFGKVVVAVAECAPERGLEPAAWVILANEDSIRNVYPFEYSVHRAILPEGMPGHFDRGTYDLDRTTAFGVFASVIA